MKDFVHYILKDFLSPSNDPMGVQIKGGCRFVAGDLNYT